MPQNLKRAGWCVVGALALGLAGCGGSGTSDPSGGQIKSQADAEAKYRNQGGPPRGPARGGAQSGGRPGGAMQGYPGR